MGQNCGCNYGSKAMEKQCNLANNTSIASNHLFPHNQLTLDEFDKKTFAPVVPKVNFIMSHIRGYLKRKRFILVEREELQRFNDDLYNTFVNEIIRNPLVDQIEKTIKPEDEADSIGMSYNQNQTKSSSILKSSIKSPIWKEDRIKFKNRIFISYFNSSMTNDKREILNKAIAIYKGDTNINNQKHGYGIMIHRDGSKEIGTWSMDKFTGWNRYINEKGVLFIGNFIEGALTGKGEQHCLNNTVYKGNFINGLKDGIGVETTSKGVYEGMFKNDEKNGKGKVQFQSGDVYEGDFVNNKFEGTGRYIWKKSGHEYIGNYKEGKFHGKGFYKISDTEYYKGDYVNGVKEGHGEIHIKDNFIFIGPFIQGHPHGVGYYENRKKFKGEVEFINGKINKQYKPSKKSVESST